MKKFLALVAVFALVAFATPVFAAANPFMDVPMNHWAYDAIGQLAARGVLSGYPNGAYKGNQPMTRYEVASAVARALAVVDMTKASKQDVEMLKKLVVEFKDELDALGVKVDQLDSRVAVLEQRLGGWSIGGQLRYDVYFTGEDGAASPYSSGSVMSGYDSNHSFTFNRARLWFTRVVNDDVSIYARIRNTGNSTAGTNTLQWQYFWADIKLGWDFAMRIGKFGIDWESDAKIYHGSENDGIVLADTTINGMRFTRSFGLGDFTAFVGQDDGSFSRVWTYDATLPPPHGEWKETTKSDTLTYGARLNFNFNEQFRLAGSYFKMDAENPNSNTPDAQWYWVDAHFNFTPNIALKGMYAWQDADFGLGSDTSHAFKAILDVKQAALNFTSLWVEYASFEQGFVAKNAYNQGLYNWGETGGWYGDDTKVFFVRADQRWNDKWSTFLRYVNKNSDIDARDLTNYSVGFAYRYNPAVTFELMYDKVDYDDLSPLNDDHAVRFRTIVNF